MKKVGCIFSSMVLLLMVSGCMFDAKLRTEDKMQKYAIEHIADDAVVESVEEVEMGLQGNKWTLYLERDSSRKFIVYEFTSRSGGVPSDHLSDHSDFANVWIKELFYEYKIDHPTIDNIVGEVSSNTYCDNCGSFIFRIDCSEDSIKEEETSAIDDFVSYVQDTGINFEKNSEFGYKVICKN